mgnify:CR=1 FL=1|tara:strand:- start:3137 stop:5365 length:2229 start_codon:yes stop_codon:yes gene_type:complete
METLNKFLKIARTVYTQELTLSQYFEALKIVEDAEPEIKAELKNKTVKVLKSVNAQLGNWHDNRDKKDDLINKIFNSLIDYFLFGRSISYFMGEGEGAKEKLLRGATAEELENFYNKRREEQKRVNKSCENPETLSEFREFISQRGKEELTPEQLTVFEGLQANLLLKRQEQEQERKNIVNKIENENIKFELHPTKHSKTGENIFTVLMLNRIEKDEFNSLRIKAKKMNGYYSRFTNLRADPPIKAGFNFETEEEANAFIGLKEENANTTEAQQQKEEVKIQTAGDRMRERAEKMILKANESLSQERRTNTHRQASQAGRSEDKAREEIVFGKKLIKIADGFDNGTIKFLHALRNGKQLEQLETILNRGFYNRINSLNLSYTEREAEEKNPFEDVNFIEYPYPTYHIDTIKTIFSKYEQSEGMKQAVKKILKSYATKNQSENDRIILKGEYIINLFKKTASKISDNWDKDRILDQIKDFERLQKMGLTTEVILKTALRELTTVTKGAEISQDEKDKKEMLNLERSFISKKIDGFFPTPPALIEKMFSMAKVFEGETIREPSAGLGHIGEAIKNKYPDNKLTVNEYNGSLSDVLDKKGFNVSDNMDFLDETQKTDVIFMNPPFEKLQDIDHVKHAFSLLNEGGRLVSIMASKNENSKNKKIIDFLEMVEEYGYKTENEAGSFKSAFNSTGVSTIMVYLEKPVNDTPPTEEAEKIEVVEAEIIETIQEPETIQSIEASGQITLF